MSDFVLKINNITKKYRTVIVLDNISMKIKRGQIYGLIGLNGAGKSTLLKIITGIATANAGNIELFGVHEKSLVEGSRSRIGSLVEQPAVYPNKTIYENMHINRIQKGIPGTDCIDKTLRMVDLYEDRGKKVKTLSLGTKQRLGIAMALLGEPEFLILDEPINGMDPLKIVEIRELFKRLKNEYGVTMIISSHILSELYQVADVFEIIHKGKLIKEITIEKLNETCKEYLHIKVNDSAKAAVILNRVLDTSELNIYDDKTIRLYDYLNDSASVTEVLVNAGVRVEQIMPIGEDLEAYFTKLVGGSQYA